jgi:hypothetical protein
MPDLLPVGSVSYLESVGSDDGIGSRTQSHNALILSAYQLTELNRRHRRDGKDTEKDHDFDPRFSLRIA